MRARALTTSIIAVVLLLTPAAVAGAQAQAGGDGGGAQPNPAGNTGGRVYGEPDPASTPTTPGAVGKVVDGIAYAPAGAPEAVQQAIWAANRIVGRPYVYGGGHKSVRSDGYDCSGTVSYALHGGGLLKSPLDSSSFMKWGAAGPGEWITIYTNPGHVWMVVAGVRFDTVARGQTGSRWINGMADTSGYVARHPPGF